MSIIGNHGTRTGNMMLGYTTLTTIEVTGLPRTMSISTKIDLPDSCFWFKFIIYKLDLSYAPRQSKAIKDTTNKVRFFMILVQR